MRPRPSVTVAIPTFRRPDAVVTAIESVKSAVAASDHPFLEVIAIDNDSEQSARDAVELIEWELLRYVVEANPGVANARNRALDEAKGDILLFIDDDERAGPGWPDRLIETMLRTNAALVGGPVRSSFTSAVDPVLSGADFFRRDEPPEGVRLDWLRTGNLAVDLRQIRQVGLRFDLAYNSTGGEDVRFSVSARRAGLDLRWSASAIVYEDVDPHRLTQGWIVARSFAAMSNFVRASGPHPVRSTVRITAIALGRIALGSIRLSAGLLRRDTRGALKARAEVARGRGALAGLRLGDLPNPTNSPSSHYGAD